MHTFCKQVGLLGLILALIIDTKPVIAQVDDSLPCLEVDGKDDDWPQLTYYNKDHKIIYGVFFGQNHLYVCLRTDAPRTQKKILLEGLTLWLDTKGKKRKKKGIIYPLAASDYKKSLQKANGINQEYPEELKYRLAELQEMVELKGFVGSETFLTRLDQINNGLEVAIDVDEQDNLIYEVAVPCKLLYQNVKKRKSKYLGIGFKLGKESVMGAITRPQARLGKGSGGRQGRSGESRSPSWEIAPPAQFWVKVEVKNNY